MSAGLGLLRLSPKDFWAMTPRELDCAFAMLAGPSDAAPARADLAALMRRFPDAKERIDG